MGKHEEEKPPLVVKSSEELEKVKKPRLVVRRVAALAHSVTLEFPEERQGYVAIGEPINALVDLSRNLDTAIAVANGAARALSAVAEILPDYANEYWKAALFRVPIAVVENNKIL